MNIPPEAFARAVEIANQAGLNGREVQVQWIPPTIATQSYIGAFVVTDIRRTGSGAIIMESADNG